MKKYIYISLILLSFIMLSCSEYQKLLKSDDYELKYDKAIEYYNKGKYVQSQSLLDDVSPYFKGTERSPEALYYLAMSHYGQKDYLTARDYFKTYMRLFPRGNNAAEVKYLIGHCYYLDSPDARLDQSDTNSGITALQDFIDMFPDNERVPQASKELDELNNKLAYKELLSAKLYYNLGNYLGNNYLAATIVAQNALKNFPTTTYKEDLSYVVLQAKYAQAINSVQEKSEERYQDTIDEYYSFINEFPNGKDRAAADKIFKAASKAVGSKTSVTN